MVDTTSDDDRGFGGTVYGLVNKAIEDLVLSIGGERMWADILERAGLVGLTFISIDSYDDAAFYQLVETSAQVLGLTNEQVLERVGEHWVRYTGREGYGPLMAAYGSDIATLVSNVDALHRRISTSLPDMRAPSLSVEAIDGESFEVHYRSRRSGVWPLVVGLLHGLGAVFDQDVTVEHVHRTDDGADHDVFAVTATAPRSSREALGV